MPEINKTLFRRVRNKILKFPESYDQQTFGRPSAAAPCGTQACIFGWAILLSSEENIEDLHQAAKYNNFKFLEQGRKLLGLTEHQAVIVSVATGASWPEPFSTEFFYAETTKDEARVAANYINWIIKNNRVA